MRKAFIANLQIVVVAESEAEASDSISELLHTAEERLTDNGNILDWQYPNLKVNPELAGDTTPWTEMNVPEKDEYEEGDIFAKE